MFSEQDVDRELKAALSVSPSPDFAARVLQRVEADRPSRRVTQYAWLAAAASLVIAAGVVYALTRTSSPAAVAGPPAPAIAERPAPPVEIPRPDVPVHRDTIEPPRVQTIRAARNASAPRATEPEVLVPSAQMEAVRRLVRAVNEGRLVETPAEPQPGRWRRPRRSASHRSSSNRFSCRRSVPRRSRRHHPSEASSEGASREENTDVDRLDGSNRGVGELAGRRRPGGSRLSSRSRCSSSSRDTPPIRRSAACRTRCG
jgi:hypothetical protein